MLISNFWTRLRFSYLETYSFNRGPKLAALQAAAKAQLQSTKKQLLTSPATQLPALREQVRLLEETHGLTFLPLTQRPLAFHITASPVAVIRAQDSRIQNLGAMLQIPVSNQIDWMCGPVYRDALAFYNEQDKLLSVLNICFDCDRILVNTGQEIQADTTTYQLLRAFLIQLGHPIVAGER